MPAMFNFLSAACCARDSWAGAAAAGGDEAAGEAWSPSDRRVATIVLWWWWCCQGGGGGVVGGNDDMRAEKEIVPGRCFDGIRNSSYNCLTITCTDGGNGSQTDCGSRPGAAQIWLSWVTW